MAERFYLNCELKPGEIAVLEGNEAHHLAHVSRLRPGDAASLFNGNGCEYPVLIKSTAKRRVSVEIVEERAIDRELPITLVTAAPLPKGDRAAFLIEKLTEIGVTAFVPLRTERSVVHPGPGKLEKLRRHVIEASKQCGRNVLMRVEETTDWRDFVRVKSANEVCVVAHPGGRPIQQLMQDWPIAESHRSITIAVGPEGGWTDGELQSAGDSNWWPVDCGRRIMRIETAAIFLASVVAGRFGV